MPIHVTPPDVDAVRPEDEQRVHEALDAKVESLRGKRSSVIDGVLEKVRGLYAMLRDPDFTIEWRHKAVIIACLLYFISPVDMVPDFIPGVGFIDDALILGWGIKTLRDVMELYQRHRLARASAR
jgi:uncharacterized membrane protein YkvA (DUF1232 family)